LETKADIPSRQLKAGSANPNQQNASPFFTLVQFVKNQKVLKRAFEHHAWK